MFNCFLIVFLVLSYPSWAQDFDQNQDSVSSSVQPTEDESDVDIPESAPVDTDEDIEERSQALDTLEQEAESDEDETADLPISLEWIPRESVVIKGLDKVTARVFSANVLTNQKVRFGTLEFYVRKILEKPPEETPEKIAFIEIYDTPPGKKQELVFAGWMFASSPALSALEHPIYDIWIIQN